MKYFVSCKLQNNYFLINLYEWIIYMFTNYQVTYHSIKSHTLPILFVLFYKCICHSFPEKAMATDSSTLARKIPWMEGPGRLQSMGSLGVGYDWATSLSLFTFMHWRRKWQPTPVFLPGESQGRGAWWAAVYGVAQSWTRLKWLSSSSHSFQLWMLKM